MQWCITLREETDTKSCQQHNKCTEPQDFPLICHLFDEHVTARNCAWIVITKTLQAVKGNIKSMSINNSRIRCVILWQETKKCRQTFYGSKWWPLTSCLIISQSSLWHLVQLEGHMACHNMILALLKHFFPKAWPCIFFYAFIQAQRFLWCTDTPTGAT